MENSALDFWKKFLRVVIFCIKNFCLNFWPMIFLGKIFLMIFFFGLKKWRKIFWWFFLRSKIFAWIFGHGFLVMIKISFDFFGCENGIGKTKSYFYGSNFRGIFFFLCLFWQVGNWILLILFICFGRWGKPGDKMNVFWFLCTW